eukprot:CAMPEP_0197523654 /NCGR_PEP_ID=MMETSP1318-20131121/8539_1 /TAXON_ID=552666 /ORGANISM="Partenskyella glossopodia, Strain RCC365" /LENGTH=493 /DNA_ID=CAMNT_0043076413 /DNA_START=8 /DNA_END=1489 /DNA_ORIENTATION=-
MNDTNIPSNEATPTKNTVAVQKIVVDEDIKHESDGTSNDTTEEATSSGKENEHEETNVESKAKKDTAVTDEKALPGTPHQQPTDSPDLKLPQPMKEKSASARVSPTTDPDLKKNSLRSKRAWSVSDLTQAISKSVSTMADRAKKYFANGAPDSPEAIEDLKEAEEGKRKKEWIVLLKKKPGHSVMSTSKVNRLCWKGIPGSIRGAAWKAIIGNDLKITPELFKINLKRGKRLWEEQVGANAKLNGGISKEIDEDEFSREDSMRIIQADIPRTFPQLKFFHQEGPLHTPLLEVLQSYVCYRPDVGYVQGMSYLAAILLLNMSTLDAFQCLANLLNQDIYFAFFRMDVEQMKTHLRVYQSLLKEKLPNLHKHFETVEIKPGMYLYEWLLTIYSRSLPIDIAHRIWDNFLYHGQVFLFRTALGMLRLYEPQFLNMSFEDCLSILNRPPEDINEAALFENINRIQLTSKRFDRMVAKCTEEMKLMAEHQRRRLSDCI